MSETDTSDLMAYLQSEGLEAKPLEPSQRNQSARGSQNEILYRYAEPIFGAVAPRMVSNGWSIYPQTKRDRMPGTVNHEMIKWSTDHNLVNELPKPEALRDWIKQCSTLNVAVVFGPASGNTFAVDIDVTDPDLSQMVQDITIEHLGPTPFRRVGNAPKIAFIYRHAPDDPVDNTSRHFAAEDEDKNVIASPHGLEVVASGKSLTFYGHHHKTGRYFKWLEANPLTSRPEDATLVTSEQVAKWLEAINEALPFYTNQGGDGENVQGVETWTREGKVARPQMKTGNWPRNADGLVCDNREQYLTQLAFHTASFIDNIGMDLEVLTNDVADAFLKTAEATGRWAPQKIRHEARSRVKRVIEGIASGKIRAFSPYRDSAGNPVKVDRATVTMDGEHPDPDLTWLPRPPKPGDIHSPRNPFRGEIVDRRPDDVVDRALQPDRTEIAKNVDTDIETALAEFFDRVDVGDPVVMILQAPTGAGKTSKTLDYIARDPRTYQDIINPETFEEERRPIVFLLPTYANIDELREKAEAANLDPELPDDELLAAADARGIMSGQALEMKLKDLRRIASNAGLSTMTYKGRLQAGCRFPEKMSLLMQAGIGTSSLCSTDVTYQDGTKDTVFCPHYHECPAILQRQDINRSHIVFMPHAFASLNIPEDLKSARAVIIDERIHHMFLHTTELSPSTLHLGRRPPRLTRKEREEGQTPEELLADRDRAAAIADRALRDGRCPANAFFAMRTREGGNAGEALVRSAMRVCSSAIQKDNSITPDTPLEDIQAMCEQPTGTEIREEYRFWSIIADRMSLLVHDDLLRETRTRIRSDISDIEVDPEQRAQLQADYQRLEQHAFAARGERDMRLQFLRKIVGDEGLIRERIRLSWRTTPNWTDIPTLLLDASAAPEIIQKVWRGVEVVPRTAIAPLNVRVVAVVDRTYSNASLLGGKKSNSDKRHLSANLLGDLRKALSLISGVYGFGRVVVGTSMLVRRLLNTAWTLPSNLDWCHYGAIRGLDFAKNHVAAVSIGRMELPIHTVDGLVAALTYDDEEVEEPFDKYGSGRDEDGRLIRLPMEMRRLPMRSGKDVKIPTPIYPGKWARLIQAQYREEELLQLEGRLRPVYRAGPAPVWFAMSSVIPEGTIIDDVLTLSDMIGGSFTQLMDVCRLCHGVLDPLLMTRRLPHLYKTVDQASRALVAAGLDPKTGEVDGRKGLGFSSYRYRIIGSDEYAFCFALASGNDLPERLATALADVQGTAPEVVHEANTQQSMTKHYDDVDTSIGSLDSRHESELQALEAVYKKAKNGPVSVVDTELRRALGNLVLDGYWDQVPEDDTTDIIKTDRQGGDAALGDHSEDADFEPTHRSAIDLAISLVLG